jgi:hypothetical protein
VEVNYNVTKTTTFFRAITLEDDTTAFAYELERFSTIYSFSNDY